jgi:hypothetical protein
LVKLNAKMMNTSEFSITRDQRPYAGAVSWFMVFPLPVSLLGLLRCLAQWCRFHVARGRGGRSASRGRREIADRAGSLENALCALTRERMLRQEGIQSTPIGCGLIGDVLRHV